MSEIIVIKRDGSEEDFDVEKVSNSIMAAAMTVGGEDVDLADELADIVRDILESNEIEQIDSANLQNIVEKTLIEEGHAATARQYILKGADRNRMREMDSALMRSFEEITFQSQEESETKRENANIDANTAMGTMLKYGSEGAKKFNLLYMMSKDIADAHKNGDIHIHDLDFLTLTETCVSEDTKLHIKLNDKDRDITAYELYRTVGGKATTVNNIIDTYNNDLYILSSGKYTKVKNVVAHDSADKIMLSIKTSIGELKVTNDHKILTSVNGKLIDIKACDLKIGDSVSVTVTDNNKYINQLSKITSISEIEYKGFVIDLETEDHHFTANGFNVHNCCQIPLDKLFEHGFNTGHGFLREPGGIRTAGAQAAIAIQSNQNDQHGGQSIPMFDYYLAPYVALTYVKKLAKIIRLKYELNDIQYKNLKSKLINYRDKSDKKLVMNDKGYKDLRNIIADYLDGIGIEDGPNLDICFNYAYDETYDETFQSMEAFIHNLNTMHSRAGRSTAMVEVPVTWETLCPAV